MEERKYVEESPVPVKTKGKSKLSVIGPGIVLAATGIGAGDMITSTVAGAQFGISLAWAAIIGVFLKFCLTEGVGRFTLATGKTIMEGWRSLGRWTMGYFFVYVTLFGLIYGAAIATTCGLMMYIMFPIMPLWAWAMLHSVAGFALIWFGRYKTLERVITVLIGIMFTTVVGSAIMLLPSIGDIPREALIFSIPDGSIFRILGIMGGIGGTMALAAYGYWIRANGWKDKSMVPTMRLDASVAFIMTGIFAVSLMIVSAQFLYGSGVNFVGAEGVSNFLDLYGENFGTTARMVLNIGFWAAAFTSLVGSWNGIPYLFADFVRIMKKKKEEKLAASKPVTEKDPAYRAFLAWLTFPSMLLFIFNQPVGLVLLYAALGSLFLPFLALTLLFLLNSKQVGLEFRNRLGHNAVLVFVIVVFVTLGVIKFI
ncbi:Nramp family divalent metal transporter [Neobacillus kokaensis]|uniref:Iron transporter n=1 Tax=Neobacillus kokaensis TaxID=2759023 RepID=A0ABQ3N6D7_9BACI|nr:Nramp family divalent metal transporter [Neobacillus kokaensis]GHH99420.1 iron transporter [Neobacillus kokaensis]